MVNIYNIKNPQARARATALVAATTCPSSSAAIGSTFVRNQLSYRNRNWFTEFIVHHHARPLYVPQCCTGAQLLPRQTRYMYALKAPTCPHDKTSSTYPFQSCKELSLQFCNVFLMHASSSMLGRSPVDCCDPCLSFIGPCFGTSFGSSFGPRFGHYNTN